MLTLVEFQMINKMRGNICRLEYLPNLAAGQLMACLKTANIKASLVKGQTRYFQDIFLKGYKEISNLLSEVSKEDMDNAERIGYKNISFIKKALAGSDSDFRETLRKLYRTLSGQSEEDYLDRNKLLNAIMFKKGIFELYDFFYGKKKNTDLSIISNLCKEIRKKSPDILFFSFSSNYDYAHIEYVSDYVKEAINTMKRELQIPLIAAGQVLPTIENPINHIFKNLDLDAYIFDEGFKSLPEIAERIENGKDFKNIPNLSYMRNGKTYSNFEKGFFDFNMLPVPDFAGFDLDLYFFPKRMLPINVASVCYWKKCVFCGEVPPIECSIMNSEKFIEIIDKYRRDFKTNFVEIQSTCPSPDQMIEYMAALHKKGIKDMYFALLSRFEDKYLNKNVAKILYKGGVRYMMWGLESGCENTLERMNKGINLKVVKIILKNFHETGIRNMCYVIIGFPGETKGEFNQTLKFLNENKNNIDGTIITHFNLFKNSLISRNPSSFFIDEIGYNEDNLATYRFNLKKGLSPEESKNLLIEIREKIEKGKLAISNKNQDPIDQFYLDKISGHDALHHILFYLACHNNPKV